jgi:hypothetical protein
MLRFQTTLQSDARRRVYLPLPAEPEVRHLAGTVNGMRYRGAVESIDGSPGLVLGPVWRRGCGLEAGFPGSTAGALSRGSELVEPQHEFLDLG